MGRYFTPIPEFPTNIANFTGPPTCRLPNIFTNTLGIAAKYNKRALPPGYASFMHLGPKAKNGDWSELALRNPIAMFLMGLGYLAPVVGFCYSVFTMTGRCGTPFASERPFQRTWRYVLYIFLFSSTLFAMAGLVSAYMGLISLLSTKLQLDEPPKLDQLIQDATVQIKHIFFRNKQEAKDLVSAAATACTKELFKALEQRDSEERKTLKAVRRLRTKLKKQIKNKITLGDDFHQKLHFVRDVYRQYMRLFADHLAFVVNKDLYEILELGDYPSQFLCPRMYPDYEDAIGYFEEMIDLLEIVIEQIDKAYTNLLTSAYSVIETYGSAAALAATDYYDDLGEYGDKLTLRLHQILQQSHEGSAPAGDAIYVPETFVNACLLVCVTFTIIFMTLIMGLIVGVLGERSPRDIFGFNKTTAGSILTAVIMATLAVYAPCAIASSKLYYYALVVQNGVCNISSKSPLIQDESITIFHSCTIPNTVYTRMVSTHNIEPIKFKDSILTEVALFVSNRWADLTRDPYENATDYSDLVLKANLGDELWPESIREACQTNRIQEITKEYAKYKLEFRSPKGYEPNMHSSMQDCLKYFADKISSDLIPKYMGTFTEKWNVTLENFVIDFPRGIGPEIQSIVVQPLDVSLYTDGVFEKFMHASMNNCISGALRQYHLWIRDALTFEIGPCGILADAIKGQIKNTCDCMTSPLNGSWTGLFWVLFTLPSVVLASMALANNFKKVSADYSTYPI